MQAVRAALSVRIRAREVAKEARIVLLASELTQQNILLFTLVDRAELLLEVMQDVQIALNEAAAYLVSRSTPPEGTALYDLGTHRLQDLGPAQPIHLPSGAMMS
jgi:hypothetical protein